MLRFTRFVAVPVLAVLALASGIQAQPVPSAPAKVQPVKPADIFYAGPFPTKQAALDFGAGLTKQGYFWGLEPQNPDGTWTIYYSPK